MNILDFLVGKYFKIASGRTGFIEEADGNNLNINWDINIEMTTISKEDIINIIKWHNLELKKELEKYFPEYLF